MPVKPMKQNLDIMLLREYVDNYLKENKISKTDFARSLGFAYTYFSETLRAQNPKGITEDRYKIICKALNVPKSTFIVKPGPKRKYKKRVKTEQLIQPEQVVNAVKQPVMPSSVPNVEISADQFNALVQAINNLGEAIASGFDKMAATQGANAIIQGKIYGELSNVSEALGVPIKSQTTANAPVYIKSKYVEHFGGKK